MTGKEPARIMTKRAEDAYFCNLIGGLTVPLTY